MLASDEVAFLCVVEGGISALGRQVRGHILILQLADFELVNLCVDVIIEVIS